MAKRGRLAGARVAVQLSAGEREALRGFSLRRKAAQAIAMRARIVLLCAEGLNNEKSRGNFG